MTEASEAWMDDLEGGCGFGSSNEDVSSTENVTEEMEKPKKEISILGLPMTEASEAWMDDVGDGGGFEASEEERQFCLVMREDSSPLLSEETAKEQLTQGQPLPGEWLWILDPLDGTKDFLQGTGEYAVHLALVRGNRPVLGVVLLPEADELWIGLVGDGAWCEDREGKRSPVRFSERKELSDLLLVASRSHRDDRLETLIGELQLGGSKAVGSVGCKVATILRGETDLYISLSGRSAPKDWDMAAPEAVLLAAGGRFTHADLRDLTYNTGDVRQAGCLIASHGKAHVALGERATRAMAEIDPGFQV